MTHDLYESFARRYDLAFDRFEEHDPEVVSFFRHLFAENNVHTLLDCACGTGRHLLLFHALGYDVLGSDLSAAMLAQARQNLAKSSVEIPLCQADYCHLPWYGPGRFDAVVCLGSIGYLPDEVGYLQAFRSMRGVLREGGILVSTATLTDKQWAQRPRFLLATNTPVFSRLYVIDYLERAARYNVLDIFHGEGCWDLDVWSTELTVLLREDQQRLLTEAGFRSVDFFGTFAFDPYDETTSDRLIAVARR
jgi:ubiquinone/menaquinone biosynthesis C-methylase UbiE